jgi:hypothetical protein
MELFLQLESNPAQVMEVVGEEMRMAGAPMRGIDDARKFLAMKINEEHQRNALEARNPQEPIPFEREPRGEGPATKGRSGLGGVVQRAGDLATGLWKRGTDPRATSYGHGLFR